MGEVKLTFKRYEKKYLLSAEKFDALFRNLSGRIVPDYFFKSTVCSVYYDSDSYDLIRHSLDAPVYKEKLRLRSYGVPKPEDSVFVELKKKFDGIVYKRRLEMPAEAAREYLAGHTKAPEDSQMFREIDWVLSRYTLSPKAFIACDREAYVAFDNPELRITFDRDLRWRDTELDLCSGSHGQLLTDEGQVLMEVKISGAIPLWLAHLFSELEVFPTGYSKYGTCYNRNLLEKYFNGVITCV